MKIWMKTYFPYIREICTFHSKLIVWISFYLVQILLEKWRTIIRMKWYGNQASAKLTDLSYIVSAAFRFGQSSSVVWTNRSKGSDTLTGWTKGTDKTSTIDHFRSLANWDYDRNVIESRFIYHFISFRSPSDKYRSRRYVSQNCLL